MASTPTPGSVTNLGFLTVLQEGGGYVGGYLVTNVWGRPLDFRLTSSVQPNRVQQVLYGATLQPYLCADLIGKALVDKAAVAAQLVVTDHEAVLELRRKVEVPVLWLAPKDDPRAQGAGGLAVPASAAGGVLLCHPNYPADAAAARELLDRVENALDLAEPFARVRTAVAEARKLGVTSRAA